MDPIVQHTTPGNDVITKKHSFRSNFLYRMVTRVVQFRVLYRLYLGTAVACILVAGIILIVSVYPRFRELSTVTNAMVEERGQPTAEIAVALQTIGWTPAHWGAYFTTLETLVGVAFLLLGMIIIWQRHDDWFAVFAALGLATFGSITFPNTDALLPVYPAWGLVLRILRGVSYIVFLNSFFLFPNGRFVPRFSRWIAVLIVIYIVTTLAFFTEWAPARQIFTHPNTHEIMVYALTMFWPCIGAVSLIYRYRYVSDQLERLQTKWIVYSFAWSLGTMVLGGILYVLIRNQTNGFTQEVLIYRIVLMSSIWINLILIAVAFSISILRFRLWNIDVIINRTLVYAILTTLIIGIYIAVVGGLSAVFNLSNGRVSSLIATGIVAISFQGLRDRVHRGVNRLMFGQRDEPQIVLLHLSKQLQTAILPQELLDTSVGTVARTLKIPYVAIGIRRGEEQVMQTEYGSNRTPTQSFSLIYQNEVVGELVVSQRSPGEPLNRADQVVLEGIAQQLGAVVYAVRLQSDLQGARERLVITREEERRRLRRDLHDGLGPALASQPLQLDIVIEHIPDKPALAIEVLNQMKRNTQGFVSDIRRIIHDLRPPALDELGLKEALRGALTQLRTNPNGLQITFSADDLPPSLPAAVEAAIYRITMEAATNVIKHTHARHCWVTLQTIAYPPTMQITVEDDGVGLPPAVVPNVGLHSMRERAEELGGSFQIQARPSGGTRITVSLPMLDRRHNDMTTGTLEA